MANVPPVVTEPDPLGRYLAAAQNHVRQAKSANTHKAYASDWRAFETFCAGRGLSSLPAAPSTAAIYAAESAGTLKANTVAHRLTAIGQAHQLAGFPSPVKDQLVRRVMAGIRRVKGTAQRGKQPLSPRLLRKMLAGAPDDLRARRDRAVLLVGFAGAFQRSVLVRLRHEDVCFTDEGLVVTIPQSDQEGPEHTVRIPYSADPQSCPVRALVAWLEQSHITCGYLFPAIGRWGKKVMAKPICEHQLAKIVKRLARRAGLDPKALSAHSLRSGAGHHRGAAGG